MQKKKKKKKKKEQWAQAHLKMWSTKCLEIIYLMYLYKKDLALNNLQWLICHETQLISQVSRTLLNILDDINNAAVWMVSF